MKTSKLRPIFLFMPERVGDRSGCRSRARLGRPHLFDMVLQAAMRIRSIYDDLEERYPRAVK